MDVNLYMDVNFSCLELIQPCNVADHIFDLYISHPPESDQDLGYVNRKYDDITVTLSQSNIDVNIRQSLSQLASGTQSSSTGFVCWQTSPRLIDWIISEPKCPLYDCFQKPHLKVVELGAGIAGIGASVLGPKCLQYICMDQKHILKLLKQNIVNNIVAPFYSTTIDQDTRPKQNQATSQIEVIEFDWEYIADGVYNYQQISNEPPDLIIACDTVYNEYLIRPFLMALKTLMGRNTGGLIAIQMRDAQVLEMFVMEMATQFTVYQVPGQLLSKELIRGFVVYYVRANTID